MSRFLLIALALATLCAGAIAQQPPRRAKQGGKPKPDRKLPPELAPTLESARALTFTLVREVSGPNGPMQETIIGNQGKFRIQRGKFIIVINGDDRVMYDSEAKTVRNLPGRGPSFSLFPELGRVMFGGTKFVPLAADTVLGRKTRNFSLVSARNEPVGQLWLDDRTSLPLKFESVGSRRFGFTTKEFRLTANITPQTFSVKFPGARQVSARDDLAFFSRMTRLPAASIPDGTLGFRLVRVERKDLAKSPGLHLVYRSARSTLSLFIVRNHVDSEKLGKVAQGMNTLSWKMGETTMILMGDLTLSELSTLKASVKL